MGTWIQEKCVACRRDAPRLSDSEIVHLKPETPEWQVLTEEDIPRLDRVFSFKNFAEARAFTQQVGELAESEGHHPAILTEWVASRSLGGPTSGGMGSKGGHV